MPWRRIAAFSGSAVSPKTSASNTQVGRMALARQWFVVYRLSRADSGRQGHERQYL
jgi:hypothetical protein